jgi:hypothetical protein
MRFMLIVKATDQSESGALPEPELLVAMGKFNQEMLNAGVMLAGDGLQPSSKGARVDFAGGKPHVIDGPFAETKELIAGFWIIQVKSRAEAIEWARRSPAPFGKAGGVIEVRQVFEAEDFTNAPPEVIEQEKKLREQVKQRS